MVSLKSRSNKSFKATVVLSGESYEFDYPTMSLDERASMSRMSEAARIRFLVSKYARVVDPDLTDDEIEFLDDDVVAAIMKPINERYSEDDN
jgi:hypothetical protein